MAFTYDSISVLESFELDAMLGEGIAIYVYGCAWKSEQTSYGSTWLSDPTSALAAVNTAFDTVPDLSYSGLQILSSLTDLGTGMAFAVVDTVYKGRTYLDPDEIPTLRANLETALQTGEAGLHLTYSDIVLGASKSAS